MLNASAPAGQQPSAKNRELVSHDHLDRLRVFKGLSASLAAGFRTADIVPPLQGSVLRGGALPPGFSRLAGFTRGYFRPAPLALGFLFLMITLNPLGRAAPKAGSQEPRVPIGLAGREPTAES
jgi:hypothetical protein